MRPPSPERVLTHKLATLEKGKRYKLRTRIHGVQRYDREHVLVFLGIDRFSVDHPPMVYTFSGREPDRSRAVCGTVEFAEDHILEIEKIPDNTQPYINRRA